MSRLPLEKSSTIESPAEVKTGTVIELLESIERESAVAMESRIRFSARSACRESRDRSFTESVTTSVSGAFRLALAAARRALLAFWADAGTTARRSKISATNMVIDFFKCNYLLTLQSTNVLIIYGLPKLIHERPLPSAHPLPLSPVSRLR